MGYSGRRYVTLCLLAFICSVADARAQPAERATGPRVDTAAHQVRGGRAAYETPTFTPASDDGVAFGSLLEAASYGSPDDGTWLMSLRVTSAAGRRRSWW